MTLFFCHCCGLHYEAKACPSCGGSACWWCLEWAYPCIHRGDSWCAHFHTQRKVCTHDLSEVVEHQVVQP